MKPELIDGFVVLGDEAYLPSEWDRRKRRLTPEQRERRRKRDRERRRRLYAADPERFRAMVRAWRTANPERAREFWRAWDARNRRHVVGSLHSLACSGPTRATGCRCKKIRVYDKPDRLRAV